MGQALNLIIKCIVLRSKSHLFAKMRLSQNYEAFNKVGIIYCITQQSVTRHVPAREVTNTSSTGKNCELQKLGVSSQPYP